MNILNDEQAQLMVRELTRELVRPILKSLTDGGIEYDTLASIHTCAIMAAMCIIEEFFGEDVLRPYMQEAKQQAREYAGATRH